MSDIKILRRHKIYTQVEAEILGFNRKMFSSFEQEDFIFGSNTYQDFIRDKVDFVIIELNNKFNLMRKSKEVLPSLR